MSDWRVGQLGDLATGIRGVSYTPDQLREFKGPATVTLLRSNNIQSGRLNFSETQIVPRSVVSDAQVMRAGDIAVCMSNGSKSLVGKAAPLVADIGESLTVGAFCSIFRPTEGADPDFAKYLFQSADYRKQLDFSLAGSAINNLRSSELQSFRIPVPPAREQQGIAKVLDTLDTTIRQTEAILEKLEQVKQGLLHDLLTRGIDANGELRPLQSHAPHLYKDSPVGWIPVSWSCPRLAELADVTVAYVGPTNPFYTSQEHGVLFLRTGNITDRGIDLGDVRWVTAAFHRAQQKSALSDGDVVVSRVGYTGTAAVVQGLGETNAANMIIIRPQPALAAHWIRRLFGMDIYGRQVSGFTAGSAQPVLNIQLVERLLTPTPPMQEQTRILDALDTVDQRLDGERTTQGKLQLLKSGLMDDLLTGRVRVTPLLD